MKKTSIITGISSLIALLVWLCVMLTYYIMHHFVEKFPAWMMFVLSSIVLLLLVSCMAFIASYWKVFKEEIGRINKFIKV